MFLVNYSEKYISLGHGREHWLKVVTVHRCGGGKFSHAFHNIWLPLTPLQQEGKLETKLTSLVSQCNLLRKATVSFFMSVSVRPMQQFDSQ